MLILTAPFASLTELVQSKYRLYPASILLKEKYNNIAWLENYKGRVVILHGEEDIIIPPRFSKYLYDAIPTDKKEYVSIPAYGHNDIWDSDVFIERLEAFLGEASK